MDILGIGAFPTIYIFALSDRDPFGHAIQSKHLGTIIDTSYAPV